MLRKLLTGLVAAVVLVAALLGVAWAVDRSRGLELAGRKLGDDPTMVIAEVAAGYGALPVVVTTPGGRMETTAGELGLTVDVEATRASIEEAKRPGPVDWVQGVRDRRAAALIVRVDEDVARTRVREKDPTGRTEAVEPAVEGTDDGIQVVEGKPGRGLDPTVVVEAVTEAARTATDRIEVVVEPGPLAPRFDEAAAEAVAERARALTEQPLAVSAAGTAAEIGPATLRSWLRSNEALELLVDEEEVLADLAVALEGAATPTRDATISIQGGQPVITPGTVGIQCCAPEAAGMVLAALDQRPVGPLDLPVTERQPARTSEDLRQLKIVEQISTFTTRFPAGQSRVTNIHRISDLMDGTVIGPGGRLSVNDKIGRRTAENGFVSGGVIQDGVFTESIGGGISQFATTLFNAAFFGGLDIPTYQSHSIYISRYPYGREATLSFPSPDLVIANNTPYGVLVDTSYTGSSVTVSLWSTRHATGEQTNQTKSQVGACTRVSTERTRTYVDGTTKVDRFGATYRPEEGVDC